MAIVDVLDYLPVDQPGRAALTENLACLAEAIAKVQDPATGAWFQVLDQGPRAGNYREASATAMFVYALAKGVRKGYLASDALAAARRGYQGLLEQFVSLDALGSVDLTGTCGVAGLGGDPYRDGSFAYYVGEPVMINDLKGVGAFILAAVEMEQAPVDHSRGRLAD
jgi:unsaturated rhamnogalacturonyl hydrolase